MTKEDGMARRDADSMEQVGSFLLGLASGLCIGAVLGILFAPHRGEITRRKIWRTVEETRDQVDEAMEGMAG
jgi:gas vesicle protein